MKRRVTASALAATVSAHAVATSLRRLRPQDAGAPAATGLTTCVLCRRDFVVPVEWEPAGAERWWIFLRCADCGTSREVTVPNAVAERYDRELTAGTHAIDHAAHRLEQDRMREEADAFVSALRHGLIEPGDFAR